MKRSFNPTSTSLTNEHTNRNVSFETEIEQNMTNWNHQINQMNIGANNLGTDLNNSNPYQRLEYEQGVNIFEDNNLNYFRNELPFDTSLLFSSNIAVQPQPEFQSQSQSYTHSETAKPHQDKIEENSSVGKGKGKQKEKVRKNSKKDRSGVNLRELKPLLPNVGDPSSSTNLATELNTNAFELKTITKNPSNPEVSVLAEELATKSNYQMLKEGNYSLLGMKFNDEVKSQVEKRKLSHKMAEKIRRQVQNDNFYKLKATIPGLQEKDSKVMVLGTTKKVLTLQKELIKRRGDKLNDLINGLELELFDSADDLDLSCYHKLNNLIEKLAKY